MKPIIKTIAAAVIVAFATSCSTSDKGKPETYPALWLEEMTIVKLQEGYTTGKWTVHKVVRDYLDRIEAIDRKGVQLNSVIIVNPDAMSLADTADRDLAAGKKRGPLFGVPVLLKDNIDTHDRMPNTAGSRALKNNFPSKDSYIAKKLRKAGAIIIGKTNLSEWANFRSSASSSGWSAAGGQTHNPYVIDRNPCGSSSGSGAAVSANLCMFAIGTETDGSIVCPANNNGIVGIKPTVGLLSRSGIIPISFNQDTPGPMGRCVADVAAALGPLTGIDSADTKTIGSAGHFQTDYTRFLKREGLKGKRLGLLRSDMGFSPKVDTIMMEVVRLLRKEGAEVVDVEGPKNSIGGDAYQVLLYEFKDGINKYLSTTPASVSSRNLKDLIEFNMKDSVELTYFDQKIFELAEMKGDLNSPEYLSALKKITHVTRDEGIDKLTSEFRLDALISPTGSQAWKTDLSLGDHFVGGNSSLAAISGYPSITVPAGFIGELPVGVSFTGKTWSEPILFEIAFAFEQSSRVRKAPKFRLTD